jgi:hypothetical protein
VTAFRFGLGAVAFRSRAELQELARKREGGGWSTYFVVFDSALDDMGPVVTRLAGT